jgi:signal transduction histidine kinase
MTGQLGPEGQAGQQDADRQLRALVALIEGQAEQLATLRHAVADLSGRLAIRSDLDALLASQLDGPVGELHDVLRSLRRGAPDPDAARLLAHADQQVRQLREVAADLVGADGWTGPPIPRGHLTRVEFATVVERALQRGHLGARASRLAIRVEPGLALVTSSPRLVAILVNVLDRATRRSPDGGAELRASAPREDLVRIEVADRGPAFGHGDPEEVFALERPDVLELPDTPAPDARILGLHLVRLLARSLGGDAWVSNGPSGGSVVTIELPQRRQED